MSTVPANMALGNFTQQMVTTYKQIPKPSNFLEKFFPTPESAISSTRYINWAIRREGEPVAVDVLRGTEGNRNVFALTTDKIIDPPFFKERFDMTQTDLYYRAWNSQLVDASVMADYMSWVLDHTMSMTNKIKRSVELQRANILTNGQFTLSNGDTVNFFRKSASMVTAPIAWSSAATALPLNDLENACLFLRKVGMSAGGNFIAIMSEESFGYFLSTDQVLNRAQKYYLKLTDLAAPFRDADGSAYQGRYSAGSFTVDVFTYPQFYAPAGAALDGSASVSFVPANKVFVIPENPNFITAYGAVPFLPKKGTSPLDIQIPQIMRGQYLLGDYMDERNTTWDMTVSSAPVPLPTAVDQMYTLTTA
jgi:hypothetical protein